VDPLLVPLDTLPLQVLRLPLRVLEVLRKAGVFLPLLLYAN